MSPTKAPLPKAAATKKPATKKPVAKKPAIPGDTEVGRLAKDARVWLMKTEPDVFSFEDLMKRPGQRECWDGVRNYQARNFMRDSMKVGHWVVFYHSSTEPPGVAGLARIVEEARPDLTALDPKSEYHDPKATHADPRWCCVTVGRPRALSRYVALDSLRADHRLADMLLLRPGQRLSILPITDAEFETVCALGGADARALFKETLDT